MKRITTLALVAVLMVALTVATALAAPGARARVQGKGTGKGREKVTVCHKGETITVAKPALKGHLKHGDTQGECATPEPTMPTA